MLTPAREREIVGNYEAVAAGAALELRLGFELTPADALLRDDLGRYELEGTGAVLMELPFTGPGDLLIALAERAEASGLRPVIAHPERSEAVQERPRLAYELAERGWLLQVNSTSLLGRHGETARELGWELVEDVSEVLVASDGHRPARPPHLDEAYALTRARLGEDRARTLFDGSALGMAPATGRTPSRAATRDA